MIDITPILQAVISLAALLITAFVIPWLKKRTDAVQMDNIYKAVEIAVEAAEKIFKGPGKGVEKLFYVEDYLAKKGIKLNTEDLETYINSAVQHLRKD